MNTLGGIRYTGCITPGQAQLLAKSLTSDWARMSHGGMVAWMPHRSAPILIREQP